MVEFKVVLSDTKTGRSYNLAVTGAAAGSFVGKKIGDDVDGGPLGLAGYRMRITGGSDRVGTPARKDLPGMARKRVLLAGGIGYHPVHGGERRRKSVRGSEITGDFVQINAVVSTWGEKPLDEQVGRPAEKGKEKEQAAPEKKAPERAEKKAGAHPAPKNGETPAVPAKKTEVKHEKRPEARTETPPAPKTEGGPEAPEKAAEKPEKRAEEPAASEKTAEASPAPEQKAEHPPAPQ